MRIEPLIRNFNEPSIKSFLAAARFIAADQQNGPSTWIESKSDAPHTISGIKAQFLHIGVRGTVERIYSRALRRRPKLLNYLRLREQFILC